MENKTGLRLIVNLMLLTGLGCCGFVTCLGFSLIPDKYDKEKMKNKIMNVKSKQELEKIIIENNSKSNDLNNRETLLSLTIEELLYRNQLNKKAFTVLISVVSDPVALKKYNFAYLSKASLICLMTFNKESIKERLIFIKKLIKVNPILDELDLEEIADYYEENDKYIKTPLFDIFMDYCFKSKYMLPLIQLFNKADATQQLKIITHISPATVTKTRECVKFLNKVAKTNIYDKQIRKVAEKQIILFNKNNDKIDAALSKIVSKEDLKDLFNGKEFSKIEYKKLRHVLFNSKTADTKKAILEFLAENCEVESEKIGDILAEVVVSQKFDISLRKLAMSQDAFTYNDTYKKALCDYFSNKDNQKSPLYGQFIDFVIYDSDDEESMAFIRKNFDTFDDKGKMRITKNIDLSHTGDLKSQFLFFKRIIENDKYSKELKQMAKTKLSELESNKKEFDEQMRPKSVEESLQLCLNGFKQMIRQKVIEPARNGYLFSKDERETIDLMFRGMEKNIEMISKAHKVDQTTIDKARETIKDLRLQIDKLLKDNNKVNKKNDVDAEMK